MPSPAAGRLLNKLQGVKKKGDGWTARCPAHDDRHNSLSIDERDGKILLKCFTGCETERVVTTIGLSLRDLYTDAKPPDAPLPFRKKDEHLVEVYQYRNVAGNVVAEKGRFESPDGKKTFRWRVPGSPAWTGLERAGLALTDLALWGSELVQAAPPDTPIYFVEGEKAAKACRAMGLIAVTFAGGASTKDFGNSLEVLRGRKVVLWPDNDPPGREYMSLVEAKLRGIARELSVVTVPLPPKGDAHDYFASGGTVDALEQGVTTLDGPVVDWLDDDAFVVRMPTAIAPLRFTFTDLERSTRGIDTELTVEVIGPGYSPDPYTERLNFLSSSARDGLRRDLEKVFGKEFAWTKTLNTVFGAARQAFLNHDRSIDLYDIEDDDGTDFFLVDQLVPAGAATILFGDGGSLKSFIAFTLGLSVAMGLPFLGSKTGQGAVAVLDYEDSARNFKRRMKRIAQGLGLRGLPSGLVHYIPAEGIPLKDLVPYLKRKIQAEGIVLLIVDSVGPACGGKPEDSDVALAYMRAVDKLGVTTVHLAHITKDDARRGKTDYPFGCYSEDTEVLTRSGWKFHCDVTTDDEVACFDLQSNILRWERPSHVWCYDYRGPMVHLSGRTKGSVDMLVTPNHRMVVRPAYSLPVGSGRKLRNARGWHFREAGSLGGTTWHIPYATGGSPGSQVVSEDFARFLGWWISEGSLNADAPVLTQVEGPVLERMRVTIQAMGYSFNENRINLPKDQPCSMLRLRGATKLGRWLAEHAGKGAAHKRIPAEAFEYTTELRQVLFDALIEGDGHIHSTGRMSYTTTSEQLADDMQRLAISLGYSARIVRRARAKPHHHDQYTVYIGRRATLAIRGRNIEYQPYDGKVYCLTVPTGAYVTRRNGYMGIAGNSVFWHNKARRTWYVARAQEEDSDLLDIGLYCRKTNDGRKPRPIGIAVQFQGMSGPITLIKQDISEVAALNEQRDTKERVWDALAHGRTATIKELARDTGASEDAVAKAVRDKKRFVQVGTAPRQGVGRSEVLWGRLDRYHSDTAG